MLPGIVPVCYERFLFSTRRLKSVSICADKNDMDSGGAQIYHEVLYELAHAQEPALRRLVAYDPDTNPLVLFLLAHDPNPLVRRALARRQTMPGLLWFPLANDPSPVIRRTLAIHPNAPPEILARLAHDEAVCVRLKVANHLCAEEETLQELAKDPEPVIRLAVVARADTPAHLVEWLARSDRHHAVRRASLVRLQKGRQARTQRYSSL